MIIKNHLRFLKQYEKLRIGDYINDGRVDININKRLSDFLEDYLLVCFFSTSCKGCQPVIEELRSFLTKYPYTNSLVLLDSPIENVHFLKEYFNNDIPVYETSKRMMEKEFNVYGVPSIFLLNKSGQVLFTELGYTEETFNKLESIFLKILLR